jgi:predicted nucleotidyltransferase
MDKATVIDKVKQYAGLVCDHFPVQKVILFGSYAKGTAHDNSDIDVAVIVDKVDDFLESEFTLYKLRRDIDSSIEPILFEVGDADRSGFLGEIQKNGEVIYSAN